MGQLIKLQDYISRYEQNVFHYPSRFVHLKKQQWERMKTAWEEKDIRSTEGLHEWEFENNLEENNPRPLAQKVKGLFRKKEKESYLEEQTIEQTEDQDEEESMDFSGPIPYGAETLDELKQHFLDQLLPFQIKWASSTIIEKSFADRKFFFDQRLKFFLQRFPDTFLFMYKPIFLLKKAPVEAEVILLTPTAAWCITFLEEENQAVYLGSKERFWVMRGQKKEKKILNPLLALNRTEKIIGRLFKMYDVELPIYQAVLSRNGYIDYPSPPYHVQFIEKRNFNEWFETMRSLRSPFKHMQLKGAQALLEHSQTTSVKRIEWGRNHEN